MNTTDWDPLLADAAWLIVSEQNASTSLLQRRMKLGYNRAGRLMDQMEAIGIVGPCIGALPRELNVKGKLALMNVFDGAGISYSSLQEPNFLNSEKGINNPNSKASEANINQLKSNKSGTSLFTSVIIFIVLLTFCLIIGDTGFGRVIANQLHMPRDQYQSFVIVITLGSLTYILWSIRDTKLGFLWKGYKLFWIMLFAILMVNYAKKQFKEWWKKD